MIVTMAVVPRIPVVVNVFDIRGRGPSTVVTPRQGRGIRRHRPSTWPGSITPDNPGYAGGRAMTEREDDDQSLSDLAAIAPDVRLVREVVEIARQREDDKPPAAPDEASRAGGDRHGEQPLG